MKNKIVINFTKPTKETESGRLLFTAYKIATHQYQQHAFLPFDTLPDRAPSQLVYFPNLNYAQIPNFWATVLHAVKPETPVVAPPSLIAQLSKILPTSNPTHNYNQLITTYSNSCSHFLESCKLVIPELVKDLRKINVILTNYGTTKSFSLVSKRNHALNLYLRLDQPLDTLLEGIISGISHHHLQTKYHYTWEETEVAKDTLLTATILKSHLPNYHSLLMQTRSTPSLEFKKRSLAYLNHLGFGPSTSWEIKNSEITYAHQPIKNLTKQELLVLTKLINSFPNPVSAEELGETLYPNPSSYTPWGLSKTIQRLRDKLVANNLSKHLISSARNQGYLLQSHQLSLSDRDF